MKKFLPKFSNNPKGFTLIELLVVIAIIAVLAVIAATIYSGVQSRARDGRRQSDVVAISKAYEANKVAGSTTYPASSATWFAGGVVPAEPAGYVPQYSISYVTTAHIVNKPTGWAVSSANPTAVTTTPAGGVITTTTFAAGLPGTITSFQICTLLENGTAPNIYCSANAQ